LADDIQLVASNITGDQLSIKYPFYMTDFDVSNDIIYVLDSTGVVTSFSFENFETKNI
jgi:hypothetical protein